MGWRMLVRKRLRKSPPISGSKRREIRLAAIDLDTLESVLPCSILEMRLNDGNETMAIPSYRFSDVR